MESVTTAFPAKHLPPVEVRQLPEAPGSTWRVVGPGVVAAGVGLASGEFILWPYVASQVGLIFQWAGAREAAPSRHLHPQMQGFHDILRSGGPASTRTAASTAAPARMAAAQPAATA